MEGTHQRTRNYEDTSPPLSLERAGPPACRCLGTIVKILHITRHLDIGGIPRCVLDLSSALRTNGHQIVVASMGGVQVAALEASGIRHYRIPLCGKFEFGPGLWHSWLALLPLLRKESFDIVHAHTRMAQVLAHLLERFHGIPAVTTCHGFFKPNPGRRFWPCWGQKVIAVSPAVAEHLATMHRVPNNRIVCIPNGIDASKYIHFHDPEKLFSLRADLDIPRQARVVGTTARLSPVKGLDDLIKAFSILAPKHPNFYCLIVGEGNARTDLEKLVRDLGLDGRVIFSGAVDDVAPYLALMDIFVLPSLMEGLGLSILEAFAAGKPVIASCVGGIVDVVKNGTTGILVQPRSPQQVAQAIETLFENSVLAQSLAAEASRVVRDRFSLTSMASQIQSVYSCLQRRV